MKVSQAIRLSEVRALASSGEARRIRELADLSVPEVANVIEVSPATISRWETGDRRPRGEAALRYGAFLRALQPQAS